MSLGLSGLGCLTFTNQKSELQNHVSWLVLTLPTNRRIEFSDSGSFWFANRTGQGFWSRRKLNMQYDCTLHLTDYTRSSTGVWQKLMTHTWPLTLRTALELPRTLWRNSSGWLQKLRNSGYFLTPNGAVACANGPWTSQAFAEDFMRKWARASCSTAGLGGLIHARRVLMCAESDELRTNRASETRSTCGGASGSRVWWIQGLVGPGTGGSWVQWSVGLVDTGTGGSWDRWVLGPVESGSGGYRDWWIHGLEGPGSGGSRDWWVQGLVGPGIGGSRVWWVQGLVDTGTSGSRVWWIQGLVDQGSGGSRVCWVQGSVGPGSGGYRVWWIQGLVGPGSGGSRDWWVWGLVDTGTGGYGDWWIQGLVDGGVRVDQGGWI